MTDTWVDHYHQSLNYEIIECILIWKKKIRERKREKKTDWIAEILENNHRKDEDIHRCKSDNPFSICSQNDHDVDRNMVIS